MTKLCISGNRALYSYISLIFSEFKKWKKPTLKKFLIFQETELSHISPFGRFHFSPFSGVSIFHISRVFSFSHFSGVSFFTFFGCFCVAVSRVVRIWESFLYSQAFFTLHSFPTFGTTCFYQGFHESWQFFLEGCRASYLVRFETQTRPICLFEKHNIQQNVLVGWFYLSVKALRNTISTSSRSWTQHLIAICICTHMSHQLGHWNS